MKIVSETETSFAYQLFGILIGAFIGFVLVILGDRLKKKSERKDTKNMIIDSLVAEMQENLDVVNDLEMPTWHINDGKFKGKFELAGGYAFQSIVNGGDFLVLSITWQKPIREIYQNIQLYNKFMYEIIDFTEFQINRASVESSELYHRLQDKKTELRKMLPDTIKGLKSLREK